MDRARGLAELVSARLARAPGTIILNTVPFVPVSSVESDLHDQLQALARVNAVLFDLARAQERVSVVDAAGALALLGFANAFRERNRYMYQMPYAPAAVDALSERYADAVAARLRARRKVVVVDADNTLWGGVVGEDGVENLEVDSDYPGIVHTQLQRQLLRLKGLGILLCAVTKNNEEDFRAVFAQRAMPLCLDDFVAYRSNWTEKSENIRDLAAALNLGLDSFIFLDDNRSRSRRSAPGSRGRVPPVRPDAPRAGAHLSTGSRRCAPGTSPPRIWPRPSSTAARPSARSCSAPPPRWTSTSPPSRSGCTSPATTRAPCGGSRS